MTSRAAARRAEVTCIVDVDVSETSLLAQVELLGIEVGPGDSVHVHGDAIDAGSDGHRISVRRATVTRAGWLTRVLARFSDLRELGELCEVGFSSRRNP